MAETTVGIVANPASGRDIRRLVAGASVFDNAEKGSMVYRLMVGLGAVGVRRVLMMPAASGLYDALERNLRSHGRDARLPELELLEMPLRHDAQDTVEAVECMLGKGVSAIAVLGGDGTSRLVARHCGEVPICPLSTGTNNAFPEMREATVAGLATGLVATGRLRAVRRKKILRVRMNGHEDCALVDVAASGERFVGARALWRPESVYEIVVASAAPDAVGLSAVAGLLAPLSREDPFGLHLRLAPPEKARRVLKVPLAPGLVVPVGVTEVQRIPLGEEVELEPRAGVVALDGEREMERGPEDRVGVVPEGEGPLVVDVAAAMRRAAREGLLEG
ncbi:ATP-NAD kinase [Rubrobacter xylanophilus]|uniref:ATP-NAD kinase n=1 Tax=Rubrobacter xylanophilus TaxID=49319 RepID=A0A510HID5_9ACTN|nr:NAD(+)/NADH kinase [Rubrobacter xylanophilus]BBL79756.1 ATP-NAD kinase [Rubrobacter xylanophilus]